MQKKINFVKINKLKAVFLGIIMLLFLIFTAERVVPIANTAKLTSFTASESKYKQLESLSAVPDWSASQMFKMNNPFVENSNSENEVKNLNNLKTVKMLDRKTGTVKELDLEYYTLCSLIAEMPQSFDSQALMAQAVACRTFAVRSALKGNKHKNADICSDYHCCQSMRDADSAGFDITKAKEAVDATKGIIAVYNGEPIVAAYHASSVGYTNSSAEIWGGSLPYLVPVVAAENKENTKSTSRFSAEKTMSAMKKCGLENNVQFCTADDGTCSGAISDKAYISPKRIQNALSLRSDTFEVYFDGTDYVFTSYGFGHGVGMSQHGANALAKQGYDFYEILKYYYTGIGFDFVNSDSEAEA